jgi:hypothetical protein
VVHAFKNVDSSLFGALENSSLFGAFGAALGEESGEKNETKVVSLPRATFLSEESERELCCYQDGRRAGTLRERELYFYRHGRYACTPTEAVSEQDLQLDLTGHLD